MPTTLRFFILTIALAIAAPLPAQIVEQWRVVYNTPAHTFDGADDAGVCVAHDAAGNIFAAATTKDVRTGLDWVVRKYDTGSGTTLWEKHFGGAGGFDDAPHAIAVDAAGDVVVTGYTKLTLDNADIHTIKYSGVDGTVVWEANYNGPLNNDDEATGLVLDSAGNAIVTGYIYVDGSNGFHDFYTVKYAAATGAVIWERKFDGAVHLDDKPNAVAVDPAGNVAVAGLSYGNGTNVDYYTAKYAAADGALMWEKRYTTPGTATDIANAVACDAAGNVFVTGQSPMTNQGNDIYTAKYEAATGNLLWEVRYDSGGAGNPDIAVAIAVDAGGNCVVAGSANFKGYAAKYAAANGALMWDRHYDGPITGNDAFQGLALDAAGNVAVTGYINYDGVGGHKDLYAAKYAAANGAVIWENIYNGPANNFDEGDGVTVDADGNVTVTGWSRNAIDQDCYTAKYAAANGALVWERREDGVANHSDQGHAVAVDAAGNVFMTGAAPFNGNNVDIYTAKYDAGGQPDLGQSLRRRVQGER